MKARHGFAGIVLLVVAAASCTADFDQFEFAGVGAASARAGTSGGVGSGGFAGGTVSGSGGTGVIGTGGSSGGTRTSAGGKGGSAGSAAALGGTAGTAASRAGSGGGAGNGAGTSGGAGTAAGAPGDSGAPGVAGGAGQGTADVCAADTLADPNACGSCGNDCTAQGLGLCAGGLCGCASSNECGKGSAVGCVANRCECDGTACRPGERCRQAGPDRLCACNDGVACGPTEACCNAPAGCVDIESSPDNCGACGNVCVNGFACASGVCACDSDDDCDAGLAVSSAAAGAGGEAGATATGSRCVAGTCVCGSSACGAGERCRADGSCG